MKKVLFSVLLTVGSLMSCFAQNKIVTFQVSAPDSTPVYVFGNWNNWGGYPGIPMTPVGGGFYSASLPLVPNASYEYLFVNGALSPAKEMLSPSAPCTNGNPQYTNRVFTLGTRDTTVCNTFASCSSCNAPTATVLITFQVQDPPQTPVYVFGSWSNWSNFPGTQMNSLGNGLYSITLPLASGTRYEYQFINGATPANEVLNPAASCTNGNTQYTNRVLNVPAANTTFCNLWASCSSCGTAAPTPITLPVTFDNTALNYALTDFGNISSSIVADPANAANKVVKSIKPVTAELWGGTTIGGIVGFTQNLPFMPTSAKMSARVYSPTAGIPVRMKVEDPNDATKSVETEAMTTAVNTWETLTFDFENQASGTAPINYAYNYRKASIFFNFGTTGAQTGSDKTYYWDDVQLIAAMQPAVELPVTFENTTLNYELTDFEGNSSSIVADPMNATNTVVKSIKSATAQPWAGTTIGGMVGFGQTIPLMAGSSKMNMRVYSPDANIPVRLKVEVSNDPTKSVETEARTTTANAWETLEFDLANQASGTAAINYSYNYRKATVFFNFGTSGAQTGSDKTYYWDDLKFGARVVATDNLAKTDLTVRLSKTGLQLGAVNTPEINSLQICDVLGRLVYSNTQNIATNTFVPVSLNPNTVYFITIKVGGNINTVKSVIID